MDFNMRPKWQKWLIIGVVIYVIGITIFFGIAPYHGHFEPQLASPSLEIIYDTGAGRQTIIITCCWSESGDIITKRGYWVPAPFRWKYHDDVMIINKSRIIVYKRRP